MGEILNARIKFSVKNAADWDNSLILNNGEVAYILDRQTFKVGDGSTSWSELAEWSNLNDYYKKDEVAAAIISDELVDAAKTWSSNKIQAETINTYRVMGNVNTRADLPSANVKTGDVYLVTSEKMHCVAIVAEGQEEPTWEDFCKPIDLEPYATTEYVDNKLVGIVALGEGNHITIDDNNNINTNAVVATYDEDNTALVLSSGNESDEGGEYKNISEIMLDGNHYSVIVPDMESKLDADLANITEDGENKIKEIAGQIQLVTQAEFDEITPEDGVLYLFYEE